MKILLPAISSSTGQSGVTRHAANVARCLLLRPEIERVDLIVGEWQYDAMHAMLTTAMEGNTNLATAGRLAVQVGCGKASAMARNRWYWSEVPMLARSLKSDLVHATYPVPIRRSAFACPVVMTLHDLYPYDIPANFGFPRVYLNRAILQQSLRAADAIACVSQTTMHRLQLHAPAAVVRKAMTIYNCVPPGPPTAATSPIRGSQGEPFLLCVAQHRRNKNIVTAMQVYERLLQLAALPTGTHLVVVGVEGPETAGIHRFIHDSGLAANITLLQGISDAELAWCYVHCELLLAPSSVEGFGIPLVEAMHHHTRAVCSDIPAFREIGGSYCHYARLQPDPVAAFVEASIAALQSRKSRAANVARFSDVCIADAYLTLYQRLHQAPVRSISAGTVVNLHQPAPGLQRGQP